MASERKGRYFIIKSRMNGLVLEVNESDSGGDAKVRTWEQIKDAAQMDHQLWYAHQVTGTLRSKHRDLCLDITG